MYRLFASDERVPQHHDDRVSSQKHLGDVPVFIHRLGLLLSLPALGHLSPHLLHVLQDHVAMSTTHTQTQRLARGEWPIPQPSPRHESETQSLNLLIIQNLTSHFLLPNFTGV